MSAEIFDFQRERGERNTSPFAAYFQSMTELGMQSLMLPWVMAAQTQQNMLDLTAKLLSGEATSTVADLYVRLLRVENILDSISTHKGMAMDARLLDKMTGYPQFSKRIHEEGRQVLARFVPQGEADKDLPALGNYREVHLDVTEAGKRFSLYDGTRAGEGTRAEFRASIANPDILILYAITHVQNFTDILSRASHEQLNDVEYVAPILIAPLKALNARTLQRTPGALRRHDFGEIDERGMVVELA